MTESLANNKNTHTHSLNLEKQKSPHDRKKVLTNQIQSDTLSKDDQILVSLLPGSRPTVKAFFWVPLFGNVTLIVGSRCSRPPPMLFYLASRGTSLWSVRNNDVLLLFQFFHDRISTVRLWVCCRADLPRVGGNFVRSPERFSSGKFIPCERNDIYDTSA